MANPTFRIVVGALTDGRNVPCHVDVLTNPDDVALSFQWSHLFGAGSGCYYLDSTAQTTEFVVGPGFALDAITRLRCTITTTP